MDREEGFDVVLEKSLEYLKIFIPPSDAFEQAQFFHVRLPTVSGKQCNHRESARVQFSVRITISNADSIPSPVHQMSPGVGSYHSKILAFHNVPGDASVVLMGSKLAEYCQARHSREVT